VLAIAALLAGSAYGWLWLDPLMGIVGALVIARWSWGLIRDAGAILLDVVPEGEDLPDEIREALEGGADRIADPHVWQVGPGHPARRSSRWQRRLPRRLRPTKSGCRTSKSCRT